MTEPVLYNYQQQKTMCMNSFSPSHLAHCPLSILPLQFPHVADVLHLISDHRCSALKLDRLDEYVEKVSMYSNFRKYATPLDEKRCIITEKPFLCSLGIFLVLVLPKSFKFGSLLMFQKKWLSDWEKKPHICQFCCENFLGVAYLR